MALDIQDNEVIRIMGEIETKNAIIERTFLGFEDHGIFTAFITLNYGGGGQTFGGYSIGSEFIEQVLKTLDLESWEELKGQKVRVKAEHGKVHAIGHFLNDKWFNPAEFYEQRKKEKGIK